MDFNKKVSDWEKSIRSGNGSEVREDLRSLGVKEIPAKWLPTIASFARRVADYNLGFLLLRDEFFDKRDSHDCPPELLSEYAALLIEIGATSIASRLLDKIAAPEPSFTHFYRASISFKLWDFKNATQHLHRFKNSVDEIYWKDMADLNLAAGYVAMLELDLAGELIESLKKRGDKLPSMADGVLKEIEGEHSFFAKDYEKARRLFENSFLLLKDSDNPSRYYCEKWLNVVRLHQDNWSDIETDWVRLEEKARNKGLWEVCRDLEFHKACFFQDEDLLKKVYFGSPLVKYREKVIRDARWVPPEEYRHVMGEGPQVITYNSVNNSLAFNEKQLKTTPTIESLISALLRDLYQPQAVGGLFECIYPEEYFDPNSSKARVYETISRFRTLVENEDLGITVESGTLGFSLNSSKGFCVLYKDQVPREKIGDSTSKLHRQLLEHFGAHNFTAAEGADYLKVSKRNLLRQLNKMIESGQIEKVGSQRSTRYLIKS